MEYTEYVSQFYISPTDIHLAIGEDNYNLSNKPRLEISHPRKRAILKLKTGAYLELEYTDLIKSTRYQNIIFSLYKEGTMERKNISAKNVLNFSATFLAYIERIPIPNEDNDDNNDADDEIF